MDKAKIINIIKANPKLTHDQVKSQALSVGLSPDLFKEAWKETKTPAKRPLFFTILGYGSFIWAIISILGISAMIFMYIAVLNSGTSASIDMSAKQDLILFVFAPIIIGIALLFATGIGFLKLKKWLPKVLIAFVILEISGLLMSYYIAPTDFKLTKDDFDIIWNIGVIWYVFSKKELLVN